MAFSAEEYFQRGVEKARQGFLEEAIGDWTESIRLDPNVAFAYSTRGWAKLKLGDQQGAISDFDQALRLNPNDTTAYYNRGWLKSELGDKQGAISDYDQLIRLDPNDASAYYNRGLAMYYLEDKQKAISDFDQVIRLDPDDAKVYVNRGIAKSELGDKRGAISDFDKAIWLDPYNALAYNSRGNVKRYLGDEQGAILDFDEAICLAPNHAAAYANRGSVFEEIGEIPEAELDLKRFLFLTDRVDFFKSIRFVFSHFSSYPASYLLHRTLQKFTDNFEQFNTVHPIVDATRQQCRPWKIWEEWRRLVGSEQDEPKAHYHALALVNHYMGDPVEAFRIYDEVLDNEEVIGVPLNLLGQYYFIESAKLFREPHEVILEFALQHIENSQEELIAQNALRELYYAGQILWANDQVTEAHEFFELADDYLPSAYMQMLSLPAVGADNDEVEGKIADIRKREAALPREKGFLHGFPARPFRLEKPGEDFFAPILHYAHYREIAEALAEVRRPGEPFEHNELWKAFYWLPADEREIEWLQRREQLTKISRALLEKFRENVEAGKAVHELSALERAFADKLKHDFWQGTDYLDFEDFKAKSKVWPNAAQEAATLIRNSRRLDNNDKMLLVEYCFLRGSLSIEDTFLLYFYIDFVKHPLPTESAKAAGFGEAGQELVKLVVAPHTIFGQLLTAFGGGAAVRLLGDFWAARYGKDHINMDDYRDPAMQSHPPSDEFGEFTSNFLRYISHQRETLGAEKFEERYPLGGFDDWRG